MFFALSKVLNYFLVPSNIMVLLGLAGIVFLAIGYAHAGVRLLVASTVLIAAVGVLPIGNGLALPLETRFPRWDATRGPPTGIVVLGGGVINSEMSTNRGTLGLGSTAERIISAVELALAYPRARIVFTGGTEADFVVDLLEKLGVPRDRVIVERNSRNTAENAVFTKQLVKPKAGELWLLVTSAIHMPRAVGAFQKAGFLVDAYPVDYQTTGAKNWWIPSGVNFGGIGNADRAVHEWIGLAVYWMTGQISAFFPGPTPEFAVRRRLSSRFMDGQNRNYSYDGALVWSCALQFCNGVKHAKSTISAGRNDRDTLLSQVVKSHGCAIAARTRDVRSL